MGSSISEINLSDAASPGDIQTILAVHYNSDGICHEYISVADGSTNLHGTKDRRRFYMENRPQPCQGPATSLMENAVFQVKALPAALRYTNYNWNICFRAGF